MWLFYLVCFTVFVLNSILAVVISVVLMVDMSAIINAISRLFFFVPGFESILEGLFGPGLFKDITLFQGKHTQTHNHTDIHSHTGLYRKEFTFILKLFQNKNRK